MSYPDSRPLVGEGELIWLEGKRHGLMQTIASVLGSFLCVFWVVGVVVGFLWYGGGIPFPIKPVLNFDYVINFD